MSDPQASTRSDVTSMTTSTTEIINQGKKDGQRQSQQDSNEMLATSTQDITPLVYNTPDLVKTNSRDADGMTLGLRINFNGKETQETSITTNVTADKCSTLNALRSQVLKALADNGHSAKCALLNGEVGSGITDLKKVHFRLGEDGHVASYTIAPTRIDHQCSFPVQGYEGWFYRNVLKGKLDEYLVEVWVNL